MNWRVNSVPAVKQYWASSKSCKRRANALLNHGDEKGDNGVRAQAIGVYHDMLRDRIQERVPLDWR
jgi:hypothetical protein